MIVETENALLARLRTLFGDTLREITTHPGDWSEEALRVVLMTPPSVYLVWLGAESGPVKGTVDSRFVFYVVADAVNGEELSRPGVYQIVGRLIAGLSGFKPAGAGPMRFEESRNLYTEKQGNRGVVLYGVYFTCEEDITPIVPEDGLDDYLRHYQTFSEPAGTSPFEAHIRLPQDKT